MKKIKYLFGLLILGFGLLINQSFGYNLITEVDVFVEGVTLPLMDSNFQSSSNYRYKFHNYGARDGGSYVSSMMYTFLKDGVENWFPFPQGPSQFKICSFDGSLYQSNNSAFGLDLYNGVRMDIFGNGSCYGYFGNQSNTNGNFNFGGYIPIKIAFGNGQNFGKNFIYTNSVLNDNGIKTPHYSLGGGFFVDNDFTSVSTLEDSKLNFYRLFFEQNVNLTSPLDGFDLVTSSGSNITGSIAWQYFTENGFRYQTFNQSSFKTFLDLGGSYKKGLHFGGYGMGYSYIIDTINAGFLRWEDLSFVSVGSRCLQSLMEIGMSDPNSGTSSGCQQVGLLVLKGDSYVSRQNNAGVLVLSKNPSNYGQILYEQFDCAQDDIQKIFDTNYCASIGHGYITYNNTGNILPFNNQGVYFVGSGNIFIDLLLNNGFYGFVSMNSSQYCLNSSSSQFCFGLYSTPNSSSIKELYLNGSIGGLPSITNPSDITDQMISNCKGPFYNTPDGLPPSYCSDLGTNFTGDCYIDYGVDSSGNIFQSLICVDGEDYISNTSTWVVDENGNYISYCSGDCFGNYIYYGELGDNFTSVGNTGYFDTFFNSTGKFFKCPYPYTQKLVVGKKIVSFLNGYDPFVPINCFIASFLAGKNNILFNSGLYLVDGGPLIRSSSNMAILFYRFFDFLLCIGFILLASVLDRFFSR